MSTLKCDGCPKNCIFGAEPTKNIYSCGFYPKYYVPTINGKGVHKYQDNTGTTYTTELCRTVGAAINLAKHITSFCPQRTKTK